MTAQPQPTVSVEAYLAAERSGRERHEYYAGAIYAMAGGSARHNRLAGSTYAALYAQLRQRDCNVYPSDMRVKSATTGLYTYPDITVVCGAEAFEDASEDTLLNPSIIIEILSPSTETYDRGKKFQHYRTIVSLREYLLIAQDAYQIEQFVRQSGDTWLFAEVRGRDAQLVLPSLQCTLSLAEIYEKVRLE
ncbi:MAG: Uma2 family endonuclease [Candidatus Viridilinea halotolerans]|uniref:Uma2 family endonuclease n=1 Tax=Candidatus Viridilinea halotolerans TaxID=2491704 RepID=A0A426TYT3_9CHLR|nr:MAG: Uma2 family endonuclease [Candidatus Viridilinea halotolerans]